MSACPCGSDARSSFLDIPAINHKEKLHAIFVGVDTCDDKSIRKLLGYMYEKGIGTLK